MTKRVSAVALATAMMCARGAAVHAQTVPAAPRDVVVMALGGADDTDERATLRFVLRILGKKDGLETLRDVQMDIIQKTAPFGPVMLLVPDDESRSEVTANCAAYRLCEFIAAGRVRLAVVPHDTPWVRDYGPTIDRVGLSTVRVVDSAYYDVRNDDRLASARQEVNERRMQLLKQALAGVNNRSSDPFDRLNEPSSNDSLQSQLALLGQLAEVLKDESIYAQRSHDDHSAFDIAQATLRQPQFTFAVTPLFIDGGNLLRLDDGVCLTTKALFARNPGKQSELAAGLKDVYRCADVLYLDPLPGPVIEHVDMFVLPAGGRKLLLPSYRLDQPHVRAAWADMKDLERDLTTQASVVIERNARALRAGGYEVEFVPALLPRASDDGGVYYPTMLNALVRSDGAGKRQVVVPTYSGYEEDVQKAAIDAIRKAFGASTDVAAVESTVAAQGQGAVHCLTNTIPYDASVFADGPDTAMSEATQLRKQLDQANPRVTNPVLTGEWSVTVPGRAAQPASDVGMRVAFDDNKFQIRIAGESEAGTYTVDRDDPLHWQLHLEFDSGRQSGGARVEWLTDRSFRMVFDDHDVVVMTRPIALTELDTKQRRVVVGDEREGVLTDRDERDGSGAFVQAWSFDAEAAQRVAFHVRSDAFDPELFVVGPGMDVPLHAELGLFDDDTSLTVTFPASGSYRVVVKASDRDESGAFVLSAESAMPVQDDDWTSPSNVAYLRTLSPGGRSLRAGHPISGDLNDVPGRTPFGSMVQAWNLEGCDGGTMRIELASSEFDPVLTVLGTGTDVPLVNDDADDLGNSALEFDCDGTGRYTVFVGSFWKDETGHFTMSARRKP